MALKAVPGLATLTTTEAAVLCLLAVGDEQSGYDLARHASASVGHLWTPARSQLYSVLPRLERDGLASGRAVAQQTRPDKRVYRITKDGLATLARWHEAVDLEDENAFFLKVFYGGLIPRASLAAHLDAYRRARLVQLERFDEIEAENSGLGNDWFHLLLIRYGRAQAQASLDWVEEVSSEL